MRWGQHLHVSYCTNVHPGEGLEALYHILDHGVKGVREGLPPHLSSLGERLKGSPHHTRAPFKGHFGTGIRLGVEAARALSHPQARARFIDDLKARELYVFTLNGFPYGDFAAPVVKEGVYEPSWLDQERLAYTLSLAETLAALPGPRVRTISTVAGRFEPQGFSQLPREVGERFGVQLGELARGLARLEDQTGVSVRVALEPEPGTTLERTQEAVELFERWLWPAEPLTRRYVGLCYDTCHQAVMFEEAREAWQRLREAGVPIFKVQLSNSLALLNPRSREGRAQLASFIEPRYLHQVTAYDQEGRVKRLLDLPELLTPTGELQEGLEGWAEARSWRCHFHVPLWWEGEGELGTTHQHWRDVAGLIKAERAARLNAGDADERLEELTPHVEVETYSWGVLPQAQQEALGGLSEGIVRELEAVASALL